MVSYLQPLGKRRQASICLDIVGTLNAQGGTWLSLSISAMSSSPPMSQPSPHRGAGRNQPQTGAGRNQLSYEIWIWMSGGVGAQPAELQNLNPGVWRDGAQPTQLRNLNEEVGRGRGATS